MNSGVSRRSSKKGSRKSGKTRRKKTSLPRTAKLRSRRSQDFERVRASRAKSSMSLTELQFLAKSRGVPFGGLSKTKLIRKINNYM